MKNYIHRYCYDNILQDYKNMTSYLSACKHQLSNGSVNSKDAIKELMNDIYEVKEEIKTFEIKYPQVTL